MALRHVLRTHRVALDWLYDPFDEADMNMRYINTKWQVADMYTKSFTNAETWRPRCSLNSIGAADSKNCKVPIVASKVASKGTKSESDSGPLQWTCVPMSCIARGGCRSNPHNVLSSDSCNNVFYSRVLLAAINSRVAELLVYELVN